MGTKRVQHSSVRVAVVLLPLIGNSFVRNYIQRITKEQQGHGPNFV